MLNLHLHCGARRVERDAVQAVSTPPPTSTWVPVPHDRLLHEVESTLRGRHVREYGERVVEV